MYVPRIYRVSDEHWLWFVLRHYPFATLVTNGVEVPHATHLAVVPEFKEVDGDVVGTTWLGHLNRVNPHWSALSDGMVARLIFNGPNSYITPVLYETTPAAPTWNFVSVHLLGRLRPVEDHAETMRVVRRTAADLEELFGDGWRQEASVGYFQQIVRGVGAFRFQVLAVEGMFKLSQEKDISTRSRVIDRLSNEVSGTRRELADIMRQLTLPASAAHT